MRSPPGKPSSGPEMEISTPDSGLLFSLADGITLPFLGAVFHLGAGLNLNQFGASMAHAGLPVRQGLRHRDCPYFSKNTYLNACFFVRSSISAWASPYSRRSKAWLPKARQPLTTVTVETCRPSGQHRPFRQRCVAHPRLVCAGGVAVNRRHPLPRTPAAAGRRSRRD